MIEGLNYGEDGPFYHAHAQSPESLPQTKLIIDVLAATPIGKRKAIVKLGSLTFRAGSLKVVRDHDEESKTAWGIRLRAVREQQ